MLQVSHIASKGYKNGDGCEIETNAHLSNPAMSEEFDFETTARKSLKLLAQTKEWAYRLQVSRQQISRWRGGEKIPHDRQLQIIRGAKFYLMEFHSLEDEVDRYLYLGG